MDTIGFTPRSPWPPIDLLPQPSFLAKGLPAKLALWSRNRVLPSCQSPSYPGCFYCEFVNGFEMGPPIEIGKIGYQATMKFGGFALSWADQGKLAYGTNSATGSGDAPQIWDGFRNQDLPVIEGMNFWLSFELNFLSSFAHDYAKLECSATKYPVKPSFLEKKAILKMKFELYVAFDRSITVADGQGFAQDLTKNLAGEYVTSEPTSSPSMAPSETPSSSPSVVPSHQPTSSPSSSIGPSGEPTGAPSGSITPSHQPTSSPSSSIGPSGEPTGAPSRSVSESPSEEPSPGSTESAERQRKLMFGDDDYNTNNMWRKLSESTSDPCVILSVTELSVGLPAIGKLNFGNALVSEHHCSYDFVFYSISDMLLLFNRVAGVPFHHKSAQITNLRDVLPAVSFSTSTNSLNCKMVSLEF